jgi:hypothetical protein
MSSGSNLSCSGSNPGNPGPNIRCLRVKYQVSPGQIQVAPGQIQVAPGQIQAAPGQISFTPGTITFGARPSPSVRRVVKSSRMTTSTSFETGHPDIINSALGL